MEPFFARHVRYRARVVACRGGFFLLFAIEQYEQTIRSAFNDNRVFVVVIRFDDMLYCWSDIK